MRTRRTEQRGQQTPSADSNTSEPTRFDRRLVSGLGDDELEEFATRWKTSILIRQAVVKVLTKDLEHAILQSESREVWNSPNPLADLADLHAYRRGLRAAIKLLTN